jgi:hypothetical protein
MNKCESEKDPQVTEDMSKGASAVAEKWSLTNWEAAEKPLNQFDCNLKKIMLEYVRNQFGINSVIISENIYKALGDEFYNLIYLKLIEKNIIEKDLDEQDENICVKKKKKIIEKKADIIKRENSWNIINKEIDIAFSSFKLDNLEFINPSILNSKYIELRGIGFLLCAKFLTYNKNHLLGKKSKLLLINNIIVGMQKFINSCEDITTQSILDPIQKTTVSSKFIKIYNKVLVNLMKLYNYDGLKVCVETPQLVIYTDYDIYIPKKSSSLYSHQTQIIDEVKNSIKNNTPLLISLRTMTGTGKTTSACSIAEIVNCFKKYSDNKNLMCIFCCNIRQVMDQVSQLVYNSNIPFAISYIDKFTGLKEVNNFNCKRDEDRVVTIC